MAFSLSSWFKGKPGEGNSEADAPQGKQTAKVPPPAPAAPATPPPAVRTVMPSATPSQNPVSLRPPGAPPLPKPPAVTTRNLPVRPPARKVSFPIPSAAAPAAPAAPTVPAPAAKVVPKASIPAPAPVLEAPDVPVVLTIGDFLDRIPPGYLQSGSFDRDRVVEFRATELYSDLAKGRASVPASTIYARCPEIFSRPVDDTGDFEVQLPLQKLVEQLSTAFTTRTDQVAEENVGEIETPFLKVAMEDNARLPAAAGTNAGAVRPLTNLPVAPPPTEATASTGLPQRPAHRTGQISTISAKPAIEPPPAPTFTPPAAPINPGKRPPSTVRASVAGGKIRLSGPAAVTRMASIPAPVAPPPADIKPPGTTQRIQVPSLQTVTPPAASPSHQVAKKTARIQIPPISLKTAGSGGSPRPPGAIPPPPSVPVQSSPVSIRPTAGADVPVSFRTSPPPTPPMAKVPPPSFAPVRPTFPPPSFPAMPPGGGSTPPPASPASAPEPSPFASTDDRKISLGLAAVLRGQPASALNVEPSEVPDEARFTLPFGLVERQLSSGRVTVPRAAFLDALPESYKHVLADSAEISEVQIPLQEVFQNLPGNALTMRQDQVVEEVGEAYPTPFSQKAEEDAQRLGTAATPVAPPSTAMPAPVPESETAPTALVPEEAPVADEASVSVFEEQTPAQPEAPTEQPVAKAPIFEEPAQEAQVVPAKLETDEELASAESSAVAEESTLAPVVGVHPSESAVEPPAPVEPPPVAEALAVLESTAPGEDRSPESNVIRPMADETAQPPAIAPASVPVSTGRTGSPALQDTALQTLLMTEDELDAKGVVRHVCQLPGITGCAVMFADGLRLAGNFPEGDAEGFSAMAPPFFKRTSNFATEAVLGTIQAVTLYTDRSLVSFFMHQDICLSVRHTGRGFLPGVREKLEVVTRELARMYGSENQPAHLDRPL